MVFLIVTRVRSFWTIRERAGLGANMRYKMDFLDFCKDDIHWFTIMIIQILLCILAAEYTKKVASNWYDYLLCTVLALKHASNFVVVALIFFSNYHMSKLFKVSAALFNFFLLLVVVAEHVEDYETNKYSFYWSIYVLEEIVFTLVLYFTIMLNIKLWPRY